MKRVEQGTLYLGGPLEFVTVIPADGRKFTLKELQHAVGGFVETMIPAQRHTTVYVNEEGALKRLLLNRHTWTFAKKAVYMLNGYAENFCINGNALVVRKVDANPDPGVIHGFPTVFQAVTK